MHQVPTVHNESKSNSSLVRTPTSPRKSPRKQKIGVVKLVLLQAADKIVDIDSISEQNSPENKIPQNFTFKRLDNSVQLFNLKFNEETGIPTVHECISIDISVLVYSISKSSCSFIKSWFSYIPLPEWFRYGHNCSLNKFSMLETCPI